MSSWVAPSIAAELWRTSVDDVLRCIREGSVPVRHDGGFTFVDIAPPDTAPMSIPRDLRPPTFVVVSSEERMALLDAKRDAELNAMATEAATEAANETPADTAYQITTCRDARTAAAALRQRPLAA